MNPGVASRVEGRPCDISGEIVGTSFDNFAMPLIRYRTNDFTSYLNVDNSLINLNHFILLLFLFLDHLPLRADKEKK